jgi:hypothetical protein
VEHTLVRANAATTLKDLDATISGYGGVEKRRSSPRKRDGSADGLRVPLHVRDRIFSCAGADDAPCSLISAYSAISTSLAISFAAAARSSRSWDRATLRIKPCNPMARRNGSCFTRVEKEAGRVQRLRNGATSAERIEHLHDFAYCDEPNQP